MKKHSQSGITLIELLITLVILGILLGLALPSFQEFFANTRLTNVTNELNTTIQYARSESVKTGQVSTISAADCGSGADWTAGAFVWVDLDGDSTQGTGELLRGDPSPTECPTRYTVTATGGALNIEFSSNGRADITESFAICDETGADVNGRLMTLSTSGHLSRNSGYTGC